jgi:DNA-binding NtrC family response regulator
VQSEVGRGSTFQVFFPVATQVQAPIHEAADLVATRGSETILIVEDEERVRHALNRTLQASGYRVLQAADGPEAMRIWGRSSKEIALLLSDMVMPNGITGLDLAERFRQERPDLKVIIASGYSVELRKSGVPTGPGFAYLAKPFDVSQVCATVRACLDGD